LIYLDVIFYSTLYYLLVHVLVVTSYNVSKHLAKRYYAK